MMATALGIGLSAIVATAAQAQTGPIAGYNWSGLFVGANIGGGFGANRTTASPGTDSISQALAGPTFASGAAPSRFPSDQSGPIGGIQARYNWQFGSAVFGADVEADGAGISSSTTLHTNVPPGFTPGTFTVSQNLDFLTAIRGQLGFTPVDRLLLFANAGPAIGHVNYKVNDSFPLSPDFLAGSTSKFEFGGTVGAGLEYAVWNNLTVRGEYMFVGLQSRDLGVPITAGSVPGHFGASFVQHFENNYNIFRIGVAWHFAPPPPAPPATPVVAAPPPPAAAIPAKQMFIVFFEFDKSSLTPDGAKVVDAAADAFKKGKSDIAIAGYTDLAGSAQYNLALSHRRADAVQAALVKDGVPASAVGESWYGKQNPRVPTADGVREPQNRRVEITM
jgi:outer membrane protein OmpA-like peptidoglycan-associated protein